MVLQVQVKIFYKIQSACLLSNWFFSSPQKSQGRMVGSYDRPVFQYIRPKLFQPVNHGQLFFTRSAINPLGVSQGTAGICYYAQEASLPLLEHAAKAKFTGVYVQHKSAAVHWSC